MSKKIITSLELREIIEKNLKGKFSSDYTLQLPDSTYYCPSLDDVKKIIKKGKIHNLTYVSQKFDCDDFAFILKSLFILTNFRNKQRRYPTTVGIIFGLLNGNEVSNVNHAINFVVTDEQEFYLIEPQLGTIYPLTKNDREVYFILI